MMLRCLHTCGPNQERSFISSAFKVCHDAVYYVRFRGEEVNGIGIGLRLAPVFDALDVYNLSALALPEPRLGVLVMLESRMSSSLTTLSMSFFESSSRMRIFHYSRIST